jgi:hypothetical protein
MHLKRALIPFLALAFILTINLIALADEGHSHDNDVKQATEKVNNGSSLNKTEDSNVQGQTDHNDLNHDTSASHTDDHKSVGTQQEDHGTADSHTEEKIDSEHGGESAGHHGPVVETPPNYKILGAYGALNLSFIMIGVWNKWFRRKGNK